MTLPAGREIVRMFDRISPTYDILNRFFSVGADRRWRGAAVAALRLQAGQWVLDCGAGTGDMALAALKREPDLTVVLLDPSPQMLALADAKANGIPPQRFRLVRGVAENLPFTDAAFDRIMVAFGIRNFVNLEQGLRELHRTLVSGGRAAILEFTPDRRGGINRLFRWYMRHVMQPLGAWLSRDPVAYAYLSQTVEDFFPSKELAQQFENCGFRCLQRKQLAMGIVTLFVLDKP